MKRLTYLGWMQDVHVAAEKREPVIDQCWWCLAPVEPYLESWKRMCPTCVRKTKEFHG